MTEFNQILLIVAGFMILSSIIYFFLKQPFLYSQLVLLFLFFSFIVRPLALSYCDSFIPFYIFDTNLYWKGIYISIAFILLYIVGLLISSKNDTVRFIDSIDFIELKKVQNMMLLIMTLVVLLVLLKFGTSILPGIRTTGLSKAASGAQIYFAIVSSLTFFNSGLTILLIITEKNKAVINFFKLLLIFVLSIVFYQRGAFVTGVFFGLFLVALFKKDFLFSNLSHNLFILTFLLIVIMFGRPIISGVIGMVVNPDAAESVTTLKKDSSLACKISKSPNQEHDQVWPAVIAHYNDFGTDNYKSLTSAFFRPFFNADDRELMQLQTSVDQLNIYNNRSNYLDYNFGFSLSFIQYHFYSAGYLVFVMALALGFLTGRLEKLLSVKKLNQASFVKLSIVYILVTLINSTVDENIKWALTKLFCLVFVVGLFKFFRESIDDTVNW